MNTTELLDAAKAKVGLQSDYALAKRLRVSTQAVSGWRAGIRSPDTMSCYRLAEMIDADPAVIIASMELERAERAGKEDVASDWGKLLERLGGVAAAFIMGAAITCPAPGANAAQTRAGTSSAADATGDGLYIM